MTEHERAKQAKLDAIENLARALNVCLAIPGWTVTHHAWFKKQRERVLDIAYKVETKPHYQTSKLNFDYD
jgi:hypothetical protein